MGEEEAEEIGEEAEVVEEKPTAGEAKPTETKGERFRRLAPKRLNNVLKSLKILGNLSSRGNYEYTNEEILDMFGKIDGKLDELKKKFGITPKEEAPKEEAP